MSPYPISWQGYLVLGLYVAGLCVSAVEIKKILLAVHRSRGRDFYNERRIEHLMWAGSLLHRSSVMLTGQ